MGHSVFDSAFSWRGTIAQYLGRPHRLHEGNREGRAHDYADLDVSMLARTFDRRYRGCEAAGYAIPLRASARRDWPVDIPRPMDQGWKKDHAAGVRRLIHDGADAALANLFVDVARSPSPAAEGADRARSATEAFLYRRLETLPGTAGRFRLNVELPMPFGVRGEMVVDLLCAEPRLAIKPDGAQHLADADAYRRDRRKDALLQGNGYFVLRLLAEEVGTGLDEVLHAIQRALDHRDRRRLA